MLLVAAASDGGAAHSLRCALQTECSLQNDELRAMNVTLMDAMQIHFYNNLQTAVGHVGWLFVAGQRA